MSVAFDNKAAPPVCWAAQTDYLIDKGMGKMANVHAVTDASFDADVVGSDVPVLVDFWAEWCGPCRMIAPSLEEMAKELGDKVKIVKVNIDENPETPSKLGVRGIPTLMVFKGGEMVSQKVGAMPKSALSEWVNSIL
jgi:thioredoxin 1